MEENYSLGVREKSEHRTRLGVCAIPVQHQAESMLANRFFRLDCHQANFSTSGETCFQVSVTPSQGMGLIYTSKSVAMRFRCNLV